MVQSMADNVPHSPDTQPECVTFEGDIGCGTLLRSTPMPLNAIADGRRSIEEHKRLAGATLGDQHAEALSPGDTLDNFRRPWMMY
jgi:hypothetical protein